MVNSTLFTYNQFRFGYNHFSYTFLDFPTTMIFLPSGFEVKLFLFLPKLKLIENDYLCCDAEITIK